VSAAQPTDQPIGDFFEMKPFGVLLSPLTNREAVLSSGIEGTQATVDEVLEYEAGMEFEGTTVQDIQEIVKILLLTGDRLDRLSPKNRVS
jgi:Fic/DOC family N-terminal